MLPFAELRSFEDNAGQCTDSQNYYPGRVGSSIDIMLPIVIVRIPRKSEIILLILLVKFC